MLADFPFVILSTSSNAVWTADGTSPGWRLLLSVETLPSSAQQSNVAAQATGTAKSSVCPKSGYAAI
jgi:hypothetical protein